MKGLVLMGSILFCSAALTARAADSECYMVLAGRSTTVDGSVLLAHNEDNRPQYVSRMERVERKAYPAGSWRALDGGGRIPQADSTRAYWILRMPGLKFSHALLNDKGVAVVSDNCPSREEQPELFEGGVGPCLRELVAERASTAREGAALVGELVGRFGYNASGRTLTIADSREGWLVAMVNGRHWVAARVPDDRVAVLANSYSIHRVDLSDTKNFMGSPDLVEYAVSRGWYDPAKDGEFDFERAYARQDLLTHPTQTHRQWSGLEHIAPGKVPLPDEKLPLPFAVSPERKLGPSDLFAVLRDHYENTPWSRQSFTPHDPDYGPGRPICDWSTNSGSVFQLRGSLPVELGTTWWLSLGHPCTAPFLPLYPWASDEVPPELTFEVGPDVFDNPELSVIPGPDKALGVFIGLDNYVDGDYAARSGPVVESWNRFEARTFKLQAEAESTARAQYASDRTKAWGMLENFSRAELAEALKQAREYMRK